jgi:hypothetical protein
MAIAMHEKANSMVDTAATAGLISKRMPFHICTGNVVASMPDMNTRRRRRRTKSGTRTPPRQRSPAGSQGRVTRKKARTGEAPRLRAAFSVRQSIFWSAADTLITTKGSPRIAWARLNPRMVPLIPIRA